MRSLADSLRTVVADLTGRGQREVVEALSAQVRTGHDAVEVAREAASGTLDTAEARDQVGDLENRGDRHRERLVAALSRTLVIPIDREDLFRLSRSVDDVLDNLRDFARELDLFGAEVRSPLFRPVFDAIADALEAFDEAVLALTSDPAQAVAGSLRAKKRGNDIRFRYQVAMAELLSDEVTNTTLKRRELLRRLDVVGLRIGEAADALADGGLKRGT